MENLLSTVADAATVLAESSALITAAVSSGISASGRSRSSRDVRRIAYTQFQRAAADAYSWAEHVAGLDVIASSGKHERVLLPELLKALADCRVSVAVFVGALSEVRLVGNMKPRKAAEDITAIIGSMFGALPAGRPTSRQRVAITLANRQPDSLALVSRVPALAKRFDEIQQSETQWHENTASLPRYRRAFGKLQHDFTLVARDDIGNGRRLWQRWSDFDREHWFQFWRLPGWPGGWPGPDGDILLNQIIETNDTE